MKKMHFDLMAALIGAGFMAGCLSPAERFDTQPDNTVCSLGPWALPEARFDLHLGLEMERFHCKLSWKPVQVVAWWEVWQDGVRRCILPAYEEFPDGEAYLAASYRPGVQATEQNAIILCAQAGNSGRRGGWGFGHPLDLETYSNSKPDNEEDELQLNKPMTLLTVCFSYADRHTVRAEDEGVDYYTNPRLWDAAIVFRCAVAEPPHHSDYSVEEFVAAEERAAQVNGTDGVSAPTGPTTTSQPGP